MKTDSLLAISPLDGRYNSVNNELSYVTSEYGLIKYRLFIEVEWFKHLSNTKNIPEIPKLSINNIRYLNDLVKNRDDLDIIILSELAVGGAGAKNCNHPLSKYEKIFSTLILFY